MIKYFRNRGLLSRTSHLSGIPTKAIDAERARTLDKYFSHWIEPRCQNLPDVEELKSLLPGKVREALILNIDKVMVEDWRHLPADANFQRCLDRVASAELFKKRAENFYQDPATQDFLRGASYPSLQSYLELSRHL